MVHLINRSIIRNNENKSKTELIALFRQHISPRPRRNHRRTSCLNLCKINAGVKAVSLIGSEEGNSKSNNNSLPQKRKLSSNEKELTVNMPAGNRKEGKPVKLKRNSYDPGRANSQENDKNDYNSMEISSRRASGSSARNNVSNRRGSTSSNHRQRRPTLNETRKVRLADVAASNKAADHGDLRNDIDSLAKSKESHKVEDSSEASPKEIIHVNVSSGGGRSLYVVATEEEESHETQTISTDFSPEDQHQQPLPTMSESVFNRLDKSIDETDQDVQETKPQTAQPQQARRNRSKSAERNNRRSVGEYHERRCSRETDRPSRRDDYRDRDGDRRRALDRDSRFQGGRDRLCGRGRGRGSHRDFPSRDGRRSPRYGRERMDDRRTSTEDQKEGARRNGEKSDNVRLSKEKRQKVSQELKPIDVKLDQKQEKDIPLASGNETSGSIESASINLAIHGRGHDTSSSLDESSSQSSQWKPTPSTKFLNMTQNLGQENALQPSKKHSTLHANENVIIIQSPSPQLPTPSQSQPERDTREENASQKQHQQHQQITQPSSRKSSTKEDEIEKVNVKQDVGKPNETLQNEEKEDEEATEESEKEEEEEDEDSSDSSGSSSTATHNKKKSSKRERKKKQQQQRKRRKSDSTGESSSEEDDADEEESSSDSEYEKRRKKSKKKKRRKDKKSSSSKKKRKNKRKSDKGKSLSSKEVAKLKEKLRKELLEEIKESLPAPATAVVTTPAAAPPKKPVSESTTMTKKEESSKQSSKDDDSTSEGDDLELDYSSEEPYDEHGFLTGVSQKRDSPEPTSTALSSKEVEKKENVFDVTEDIVDDLDYDLDDSTAEEENWKRQKKKEDEEEDAKREKDSSTKNEVRRHHGNDDARRECKRDERRRHDGDHRRHRVDERKRDRRRDDAYGKNSSRRTDGKVRHDTEQRHHDDRTSTRQGDERRKKESTTTIRKEDSASKSRSREGSAKATSRTSTRGTEDKQVKRIKEPRVEASSSTSNNQRVNSEDAQSTRRAGTDLASRSSKHPKEYETLAEVETTSIKVKATFDSIKKSTLRSDDLHLLRQTNSSNSSTSFRTVDGAKVSPDDGVTIANKIHHSVYKRDTFWKDTAADNSFNPQRNALEQAEQQATDEKIHKDVLNHPPPTSAVRHVPSIGHRLLKIADLAEDSATGAVTTTVDERDSYYPASANSHHPSEHKTSQQTKYTLPSSKQQKIATERETDRYSTIREEKRPHPDEHHRSSGSNDPTRKRHENTAPRATRERDAERRKSRETELNGRSGGNDSLAPRRRESIIEDEKFKTKRLSYKHGERAKEHMDRDNKHDYKDDRRDPRNREYKDRKSSIDDRHSHHQSESRSDAKRSKVDPPKPLPASAMYSSDSPGRLDNDGNAENFTRPKKHYRSGRR